MCLMLAFPSPAPPPISPLSISGGAVYLQQDPSRQDCIGVDSLQQHKKWIEAHPGCLGAI